LVDIVQSKVRSGIPIRHKLLKWQLELEDLVHARELLLNLERDGSQVSRLVGPVFIVADAALAGIRIQRREPQGRVVEEHEIARALGVEGVEDGEDAVGVVGQRVAGHLRVGQVRADAQVVSADPQRVDGVGGRAFRREVGLAEGGVVGRSGAEGGGVGDEGGDLILQDGGEVAERGGQEARRDVVGADGARDGIVVELQLRRPGAGDGLAGVLDDVARPGTAA